MQQVLFSPFEDSRVDSHFICLVLLIKTVQRNSHWWDEMRCMETEVVFWCLWVKSEVKVNWVFFLVSLLSTSSIKYYKQVFYWACIWRRIIIITIIILHLTIFLSVHIYLTLLFWHFRVCNSTDKHFKQINTSFWCSFPLHNVSPLKPSSSVFFLSHRPTTSTLMVCYTAGYATVNFWASMNR